MFYRRHRGVELTAAGHALLNALEHGLTHISAAVDEIRYKEQCRAVTVFASTAVSSLWLTMRLTQFWKKNGDIAVNQHIADNEYDKDIDCDLKIWYGQPDNCDEGAELLFRDRLVTCAVLIM